MDPVSAPAPDAGAVKQMLLGMAPLVGAALIGALARHAQAVLDGGRWSWSRLLLEAPSVAGIAIASAGVADWLRLSPAIASAVAAGAGWVGPKVVLSIVERVARARGVLPPDAPAT